ncbi:hypothetical protein [Sphingomonas sp. BK580]|uniref:hypothetical protein n=1 Tax=Sphingomonas sp. BK580 TaxID=2586972 RepID=UPI0016108914|nr:hypothetical protein [Sphingomonas sp. BK580]MBB3691478.1 hypothetical protein [Sphingomonas sp. BK580]
MRVVRSATLTPVISRNDVHAAVRQALRRYLGHGKPLTVKQLSNQSGVADRLIECACNEVGTGDWRPLPVEKLLSLAMVLGPDFTNTWLSLARQGSFAMATTIEQTPSQAVALMAGDVAEFASYAADQTISRAEAPKLLAIASRQQEHSARLAALAAAAQSEPR